jgi:hypothetical protein
MAWQCSGTHFLVLSYDVWVKDWMMFFRVGPGLVSMSLHFSSISRRCLGVFCVFFVFVFVFNDCVCLYWLFFVCIAVCLYGCFGGFLSIYEYFLFLFMVLKIPLFVFVFCFLFVMFSCDTIFSFSFFVIIFFLRRSF